MWRFFPWFLAAGMSVVIVVNFGMAYTALHTFPGVAGNDGFDLSNEYDTVINRVERQAALGWLANAGADRAGRPLIVLTDRDGVPLTGARVEATAERPLGEPRTTHVRFQEIVPGQYRGDSALPEKGQWDLEFSATAGGHDFNATRRIVAR
jgi:nitrogen fixation protein FixH